MSSQLKDKNFEDMFIGLDQKGLNGDVDVLVVVKNLKKI